MKAFTDVEQSKILAGILPLESADMEYILEHWIDEKTYRHKEGYYEIPVVKVDDDCPLQPITHPCWSLSALLAQMPCVELQASNDGYYRTFWIDKFSEWHESAVDACVELLERAHNEKPIDDEEYIQSKIKRATPHWDGVDADEFLKHIRGSREYIFANEACEYADSDPINAFEEGAEYGYKSAVEKAQEWMQNILDAVADIDTTDYYNGNDAIDYALNKISEVIYKFEEAMEEEQ